MKTQSVSSISFTEIHHLARLNWEQDGCPQGLDMEYYLAAESLLSKVQPHSETTKKTITGPARRGKPGAHRSGRKPAQTCTSPPPEHESLAGSVYQSGEAIVERMIL